MGASQSENFVIFNAKLSGEKRNAEKYYGCFINSTEEQQVAGEFIGN